MMGDNISFFNGAIWKIIAKMIPLTPPYLHCIISVEKHNQPIHDIQSGPKVTKLFFMLNSTEHEIFPAHKS